MLRGFVEVIDTMAGRAALQIAAGEGGLFPEEVAEAAASVPGVELTVPVVSATAFTTDAAAEVLAVHGVDVTNESAVRTYDARDAGGLEIEDPLVFLSRPDSIIVTRAFAERRAIGVGDGLELETPLGRRRFTVRGLIEPEGLGRIHGGNLVVMDLHAAEQAFTRPGLVTRVDLVVDHEHDLEQVRAAVQRVLPPGLEVAPPAQRKVNLHRVMRSVQVGLQALALLGLVAAFLIVFNRLSAVFEARVWEIGVMRAMGLRPRAVWSELLAESLLIGLAGVALGLLFGVAVARVMLPIVATTTAIGAKLTVPSVGLALSGRSFAVAAALGLGATLLAAALPARRAAWAPVVAVLRLRGMEQPGSVRLGAVPTAALALGAGVASLVESWTRAAAWGFVATFLLVVAVAFAAPVLVSGLAHPAVRRALGGLGPTSRVAAAAVERNPRRSALTVATLGVGLAVVTWLWVAAASIERSVVAVMSGIFRADLVVGSVRLGAGYVEAPIDERLVAELAEVPGVAAVVGEHARDWRYAEGPIALGAVDARFFTDPRFDRWPLVGPALPALWAGVAAGELVIVSSNLSHNLGVRVGDVLALDTPAGPLSVTVGGMVHDFLSPRGTVLMTRELYRRHWHDAHVTHALVRLAAGADLDAVRAAIGERLGPRHALRVLTVGELVDWFAAQVRRAFAAIYALGVMVLVVVALGVTDTVAAGVLERRRERAVMAALGVRRSGLGRIVLGEAALLGCCGVALAVPGGLALGALWVRSTFPNLIGWVLELHLPGAYLAATAALGVGVCLLAAVLPAYHSMRVQLAEALRCE